GHSGSARGSWPLGGLPCSGRMRPALAPCFTGASPAERPGPGGLSHVSRPANGGPGPTRVRWLIFALACAASWLLYLHRYAWGVVRPSLKAENPHLDDVALGWLDSLFNLTYALGQVPGGLAGDLLGPRAVLPLLILLWSGAVAGLGAARSFAALAAVRAGFGLAQAGAYPCLSQVTRRWFPAAVRTTVQGVVGSLAG